MKKKIMKKNVKDEQDELIMVTGQNDGNKKSVTYIHRNPSFKGVIIAGLILVAVVVIVWINHSA